MNALVKLAALALGGWLIRCAMKMIETQQSQMTEASRIFTGAMENTSVVHSDLVMKLMSGYPPMSAPLSTTQSGIETSLEQEPTLDDMPPNIREALEREMTEDQERQWMLSSKPPGDLG